MNFVGPSLILFSITNNKFRERERELGRMCSFSSNLYIYTYIYRDLKFDVGRLFLLKLSEVWDPIGPDVLCCI